MANLFNLSEAAAIGIHSCAIMAMNSHRVMSAREIASYFAVSYDHTVAVLHRLRQAGLLESTRGPTGGFRLVPPGGQMKALLPYEAIEGTLSDRRCLFQEAKCEDQCFLFGGLLQQINDLGREFFSRVTLDDLAARLKYREEVLGIMS